MSVRPVTSKPAPLACAYLCLVAGDIAGSALRDWAAAGSCQEQPEGTRELKIAFNRVWPTGGEVGVLLRVMSEPLVCNLDKLALVEGESGRHSRCVRLAPLELFRRLVKFVGGGTKVLIAKCKSTALREALLRLVVSLFCTS